MYRQSILLTHEWYCEYKSKEGGYILTEIPQWRVLAGTKFRTCDLPTQIFFHLQPYLPYRIWPFSWLHGRSSSYKFSMSSSKSWSNLSYLLRSEVNVNAQKSSERGPTLNAVLFLSTGGNVAAPIFYFHCSQSRNLFFAQLKNLSIMLKHDLLLCSLEIPSK